MKGSFQVFYTLSKAIVLNLSFYAVSNGMLYFSVAQLEAELRKIDQVLNLRMCLFRLFFPLFSVLEVSVNFDFLFPKAEVKLFLFYIMILLCTIY